MRCEGAFLLDAARDNYNTTFVKVYSEKGGQIKIDTDFGTGELKGTAEFAGGVYVLDMEPGETAIISKKNGKERHLHPLTVTTRKITISGSRESEDSEESRF